MKLKPDEEEGEAYRTPINVAIEGFQVYECWMENVIWRPRNK